MRPFRFLLPLAACVAALGQTPNCALAPGWQQQGEMRSYTSENLFEYMDGNAEGYLIYRFVTMQGVNCRAGEDTLVFDVSEMADAESAYGLFCSNRDPGAVTEKIGMGGQIAPRRAIFAKGKYYVEIGASKDLPDALRAFALAAEKRITGRSDLPEALAWFPPDKLQRETVRLVPESVLGLRVLKRGYVAQYERGAKAFIVTEESPDAAAKVMEALRGRIGENTAVKLGEEGFQANSQYLGRVCFFRKGRYLAGFTSVADGQDPVALGSALLARIP